MNFSQVIGQDEVAMELKYCERCGGLWLRPRNEDGAYCEGCREALAALPWSGRRRKNPKHRGHNVSASNACLGEGHAECDPLVVETLLGIAETPQNGAAGHSADVGSAVDIAEVRL